MSWGDIHERADGVVARSQKVAWEVRSLVVVATDDPWQRREEGTGHRGDDVTYGEGRQGVGTNVTL